MSSQKRLLVIDDEVDLVEIIHEYLKPHYPNTQKISDAKMALDRISKEAFDLVISDVSMPGLSGPELIKNLRILGVWTPVMFLTGNATKDTVLTALRLGVSDVLEKPFDEKDLLQSVQRILEIEKRRNQLIVDKNKKDVSPETIEKQGKMLGLLHAVNEKKKAV